MPHSLGFSGYCNKVIYAQEYDALTKGTPLAAKSALISLNAFLDKDGIIRVGGRLANASLPYDRKHPVILPGKHEVTNILVRGYHEQYFHANYTLLVSLISARYWIVGGKHHLLKRAIRRCVKCACLNAVVSKKLTADLSQELRFRDHFVPQEWTLRDLCK